MTELRDGDSVITYGYDAAGRLAEKNFPNGIHTDYRYDSKGQIKELVHKDKEGILDRYTYQYDLLGNKTGIEKQRRGLVEESGQYQYGYDSLGRLSETAKDGNLLRTYEYDAFGNRIRLMDRGKQTTYAYNNVNQLLSKADAEVEETYTYDRRGNLSQIIANGQVKNQYLYGALNRLEQAVNGKGEAARYHYNGLGHRIGKESGKDRFHTIQEELNPMKQLQSQTISPEKQIQYTIDLTREYHNLLEKEENNRAQTFLWDGNVAGMLEEGKEYASYYLQDELGSPIRLAEEDGKLSKSYGYDEFGQDLYGNQGQMQPFGYTGYQKDGVIGTYFAQAREYNPDTGRFISSDLFPGYSKVPLTMNSYGYCFNIPTLLVDLNGAWPQWVEDAKNDIENFWEENVVGKDIVLYRDKIGKGIYEVKVHEGGNVFVVAVDEKSKSQNSWFLNLPVSASSKLVLSGNGWDFSSWKFKSVTDYQNQKTGIGVSGAVGIEQRGIFSSVAARGTSGNMPYELPGGIVLEDYANQWGKDHLCVQ